MLEELYVQNYALIDTLSLSFEHGFSIVSGETGAGKSIIVGSLSFLLGAKADTRIIRTGTSETSVSAVIAVAEENQDALNWLKARDIAVEDSRLVVRRTLKMSGRGTIYIQNALVHREDLMEFMALLFDLHGQHTHESLLKKEVHRKYLDRFAGIEEEVAVFNRIFIELGNKKKAFDALISSDRDRETRLDMLNYAVEEITKAAPKTGEIRDLEREAQRLGDFEKLAGQVHTAAASLFADDISVLSLARKAKFSLENALTIDEKLAVLVQRMEGLYYEAEDIAEEFRIYREDLVYDPERLEEVEARLALLYRLKKKYGLDEDGLPAYLKNLEAEIETISGAAENGEKLQHEIVVLEKEIAARSQEINRKRSVAALKLGARITEILVPLGMPNACFSVAVISKGCDEQHLNYGPWGADEVEFLFSANSGEPVKELSRIISGGELSRVMLAIKTVLSSADTLETLVFDEIDTGIGGTVALAVGEYLAKIGKEKQIFCVTHLASIAVRADNHLKVEKKNKDGRTVTGVLILQGDDRLREIARMLAGVEDKAALALADELVTKYGIHASL